MKGSLYLLVILLIKSSFYSFNINQVSKKCSKKINPISKDYNLLNHKKINMNTYQVNLFSQLKDKNEPTIDERINLYSCKNETYNILSIKSYRIETDNRYFTIIKTSKNFPIYNTNMTNIGDTFISKEDDYVYINPYKNISENGILQIKMMDKKYSNNINIYFDQNTPIINTTSNDEIIIFRSNKDYYFYLESNLKPILMTKFNENMFYYDIINKNPNYFNSVKNNFIILEKKNIYILTFSSYSSLSFYHILPIYEPYTIISDECNIGYLEPDKTYHLEFNHTKNRLIKLLEDTINSSIKIKVDNKEIILNKTNPYFEMININHIELKSENSIGLIKFLYSYSNYKQMNISGFKTFNISESMLIHCMDLNNKGKEVKVLVENNAIVFGGYTIYPYMDYDGYPFYKRYTNYYDYNYNYYTINIPQKELIKNESFLIILIHNSKIEARITIDYQTNFEYILQIIILITIIIGVFIFFIIFYLSYYKKCCFNR